MTTIQTILSTFDNGRGLTNTAGDKILDAGEIEAAGGYGALAAAIEQLNNPADARRVAMMLAPGGGRARLAEALAPKLAARGMLQDGTVRADAVFGRRGEYQRLFAELSPQAARVINESSVTSTYLTTRSETSKAEVYSLSMARVDSNPTYWLTAAHAVPSPEAGAALFQRAIAAASNPAAKNATVAYARYAAAATAQTDAERAQVMALAKPGLNAALERRWLEASAYVSRDPATIHAIYSESMRGVTAASGNSERLQYLSAASTTAVGPGEMASVAEKALAIYTATRDSQPKLAYAALRLVLRNTPETAHAQYIKAAEDAFARDPAGADSTLRQLLVAHGCASTRGDIVAGGVMAMTKQGGPRKDQVLALAAAVGGDFDHFY